MGTNFDHPFIYESGVSNFTYNFNIFYSDHQKGKNAYFPLKCKKNICKKYNFLYYIQFFAILH